MTSSPPSRPVRDKEATRQRLMDAVGQILARRGFTGLGVNAVAREAGVDKVLIYRYFGGLQPLIAAYGRDGSFWPSIRELAGGDIDAFSRLPLQQRLSRLTRNFLEGIRSRPATQEILAWELVERNQLTEELELVRENQMRNLFEMFFPETPPNLDLEAMVAVVGAALSYLVARSRQIDVYGGIDLKSDAGWQRVLGAVDRIIAGMTGAA